MQTTHNEAFSSLSTEPSKLGMRCVGGRSTSTEGRRSSDQTPGAVPMRSPPSPRTKGETGSMTKSKGFELGHEHSRMVAKKVQHNRSSAAAESARQAGAQHPYVLFFFFFSWLEIILLSWVNLYLGPFSLDGGFKRDDDQPFLSDSRIFPETSATTFSNWLGWTMNRSTLNSISKCSSVSRRELIEYVQFLNVPGRLYLLLHEMSSKTSLSVHHCWLHLGRENVS